MTIRNWDVFESQMDYLDCLAEVIEITHDSRAAFCVKHGIPQSSLSTLLTGKKKMSILERKILSIIGLKKKIQIAVRMENSP